MKDIKIFVSHRIDQDSFTIDNPLYYNVRCGAVFDKRENIDMAGDHTGDNISEKRDSFCELTVQYWAWKNMDAEYYGLCHYRRFFSFSDQIFDLGKDGIVEERALSRKSVAKYWLDNPEEIEDQIRKSDAIFMSPFNIAIKATPIGSRPNVITHWQAWDKFLIDKNALDLLKSIVILKFPQYYDSLIQYLNESSYIGYNCFIMKKELFKEYCKFQFGVLFELEKQLDSSKYHETMQRTIGFLGEILLGTFEKYLTSRNKYKIDHKQLVYFEYTDAENELRPAFNKNNIPVVFMSSNFYVPYLSICLAALIDHTNPEENYDIIILEKEISKDNKETLLHMVKDIKNVSLRFFNPSRKVAGIKFHIAHKVYAEEAYYRILTPWILSNYSKAIVMDCDLIIKRDLSDLFKSNLKGYLVAGVADVVFQGILNGTVPGTYEYCKEEMGMTDPYNYVNTGVLVMNLEKWRKDFEEEGIIKFAAEKKFRIQEQDILNVLIENHALFVEPGWNFFVATNEFIERSITWAPSKARKLYESYKDSPYIIHYAAVPKAWDQPEIDYAEEFWFYARKSIFYEIILSRMLDKRLGSLHPAVYDLQKKLGVFDTRSEARKLADKYLPEGSARRKVAMALFPRNSFQWHLSKKIFDNFILRYLYK